MRRNIIFLSILFLLSGKLFAQDSGINGINELSSINFFGTIKSRFEYDLTENLHRFSVRNTRFGLNGDLLKRTHYQVQMELNSEGVFTILDLYGTVDLFKGFSFTLGQNSVPFYNSYTVTPSALLFANRPFIGKFFTGTRDIGLKIEYVIPVSVPVRIEAAIYNSGVINNPQWSNKISFAGRVSYGNMNGFRSTAKVYRYEASKTSDLFLWGADLRYRAARWVFEGEFVNMHNYYDSSDLSSYYIQSVYSVPIADSKLVKAVNPALRWDSMGYDVLNGGFEVNRFTLGIGLALNSKVFDSILRLDYERYFTREESLTSLFVSNTFSDKVTFELLINF